MPTPPGGGKGQLATPFSSASCRRSDSAWASTKSNWNSKNSGPIELSPNRTFSHPSTKLPSTSFPSTSLRIYDRIIRRDNVAHAPVAQWIAHRSSEPRVTGSNPVGRVCKARRASQLRLACSFFSGFARVWVVSGLLKRSYNGSARIA